MPNNFLTTKIRKLAQILVHFG